MKIRIIFIVSLLLTFSLTDTQAQLKKRIAVARFQDRSGSGWNNIGDGVADMLVTALVKSGKFLVLEREEMEKIIQEQKFSNSSMVTPETAAKVGKLLGVELLVIGSVSEFGTKQSSVGGNVPLFGGSLTTKTARAAVDVRLVSVTTGEILAAEKEEGEESSTGVSVRYEAIDFGNSTSWDNTDIGKATREAVDGVIELITENLAKIPWSGKVLRVNPDGTILMKPGSEGNVKTGMEFTIYRQGEEIMDPDTGLSLGTDETKVGRVKVTDDMLKGKAAKAKVLEGSDIKTGDTIREE